VAREHDREPAFVDELAEQVQDLDDAERVGQQLTPELRAQLQGVVRR